MAFWVHRKCVSHFGRRTFCVSASGARFSLVPQNGLLRADMGVERMHRLAEVSWPQVVLLLAIAVTIFAVPEPSGRRIVFGVAQMVFVGVIVLVKLRKQNRPPTGRDRTGDV